MTSYLNSTTKQFRYYKHLAERAIIQLEDSQIFSHPTEHENSIGIIMQHMAGNMLSRWTDPFESDGEKQWRNRDHEFRDNFKTKKALLSYWDEGWYQLLAFVENLQVQDLERLVYIRKMGHTVIEAINRQLCHYSYHVGQIVLLAKQQKQGEWISLSIPRGSSDAYNSAKMGKGPRRTHFTDDL